MQSHLLARDGHDYRLIDWTIMPNHVHVLLEGLPHMPLWEVMKNLKGATATECNRLLGRSGSFWYREYFDRYMRNSDHFSSTAAYIRDNPVTAGLCERAELWPFGSAYAGAPNSPR